MNDGKNEDDDDDDNNKTTKTSKRKTKMPQTYLFDDNTRCFFNLTQAHDICVPFCVNSHECGWFF